MARKSANGSAMPIEPENDLVEYVEVTADADSIQIAEINGEIFVKIDQAGIEDIRPAAKEDFQADNPNESVSIFDSYNSQTDPEWKRAAIVGSLMAPTISERIRRSLKDTLH